MTLATHFTRGLSAPICLTWELTYACNLSCVHCLSSSGRRDPRELTTAECMAVVEALGGRFAFPPMDFVDKVRSGQIPMSRHAGSMALDIARGVPTEIDELTGFIVREGTRLNVPVPNCMAVYRLVKGLELAAHRRVANPR